MVEWQFGIADLSGGGGCGGCQAVAAQSLKAIKLVTRGGFAPLLGVENNQLAGFLAGLRPSANFLQATKTAQTDIIVIQAAITDAG
jgi:hypothetical protein